MSLENADDAREILKGLILKALTGNDSDLMRLEKIGIALQIFLSSFERDAFSDSMKLLLNTKNQD